MNHENLDVLVIGGGPAGMNAALVLGRAMMKTVVINEEKPRNLVTQESHGFVTRDGIHPSELLAIAKQQLEQYDTVNYVKGVVTGVKQQTDRHYQVTTQNGEVFLSKRVVFATGYKDDLSKLNLKGVEKVYGKSVFPCPFCDGWERRNQPLALFGEESFVMEFAQVVGNWTDNLIVFTNGKKVLTEENKLILKRNNIGLFENEIVELVSENGRLSGVTLDNGETILRSAGFLLSTGEYQSTEIPSELGVQKEDFGTYQANEWGKTDVEGVYVVGDARSSFSGVVRAAFEGSNAAAMITKEIIAERWQH